MFIMIGAGSGHRKKAYLGVRVCPQCGKLSHFYLVEQAQQVSVFFVPVVRWGKHWGIACSRCKAGFEIAESEKDFCLKQAQWMPKMCIRDSHDLPPKRSVRHKGIHVLQPV